MSEDIDGYKTIDEVSEGEYKDRGSKFIAYLYPMNDESQFDNIINEVKSLHLKARHHCYGYRLRDENIFRHNDDGEPSGTAGKPIFNQLLSYNIVDACCIVVRYFGGTKLGTSGLINAYKESAKQSLENATIIQKYEEIQYNIHFDYAIMGQLMETLKKLKINITEKAFDANPSLTISTKASVMTTTIDQIKASLLHRTLQDIMEEDEVPGLQFKACSES